MRIITVILLLLLAMLQYPLWLGRGGRLRVQDLYRQVTAAQQSNAKTQARNGLLDVEVRDLQQGSEAIEERARSELGMIKNNEVFYRILDEPVSGPVTVPDSNK